MVCFEDWCDLKDWHDLKDGCDLKDLYDLKWSALQALLAFSLGFFRRGIE